MMVELVDLTNFSIVADLCGSHSWCCTTERPPSDHGYLSLFHHQISLSAVAILSAFFAGVISLPRLNSGRLSLNGPQTAVHRNPKR